MRLLPKALGRLRKRGNKHHSLVAPEKGFLSAEERKELARLKERPRG